MWERTAPPVDGGGNGKGNLPVEMNPTSGELTLIELAAEAHNAGWLSFDPSGRYLYAANEVTDFEGRVERLAPML